MASAIIHMAVADEINKVLKKDKSKLLIGSISPDLSKLIGDNKNKSHFISDHSNLPNIDLFLDKYKNNLSDDFVIGYFIHLYTDYLWEKYFIPEVLNEDRMIITKLDGSKVECNGEMLRLYIYNDYTNLNIRLLEEYKMDLKIFYNKIPQIDHIIDEIPMDKLDIVINKTGFIIENSKVHKDFIFNIDNVVQFIKISKLIILAKLDEIFDEENIKRKN